MSIDSLILKILKRGVYMSFELPQLPYAINALEPYISAETIDYHYGKHHKTYVNNLNQLIDGTDFQNKSLENIVKTSSGAIFNNAAQVWNHNFYWECLGPHQQNFAEPSGKLKEAILKRFKSFEEFKEAFTKLALATFGSGWAWLIKTSEGGVEIVNTSNAGCPLTQDQKPLLTCDVWEHAYYIDVRNARAEYVKNFWNLVNWAFVQKQFES